MKATCLPRKPIVAKDKTANHFILDILKFHIEEGVIIVRNERQYTFDMHTSSNMSHLKVKESIIPFCKQVKGRSFAKMFESPEILQKLEFQWFSKSIKSFLKIKVFQRHEFLKKKTCT